MLIPMLSIHPSRITAYFYNTERRSGDVKPHITGAEVRQRSNGLLSHAARKRLYEAIVALTSISQWKTVYSKKDNKHYRFKLNFITLTFPDKVTLTDKELTQKVLKKFLDNWYHRSPKLLYIWKAEVTDRGTLHYHITTNQYIHYLELRKKWNKCLNGAGIIDKDSIETNNSTDVHSVKKVRNLAAYLTAYITKKDVYTKTLKRWLRIYKNAITDKNLECFNLPKNYFKHIKRKPNCQLWSCSKPLLNTKLSDCFQSSEVENELNRNDVWCERMVIADYFSTCYVKVEEWEKSKYIRREWNRFMTDKIRRDKDNPKMYSKF